MRPCGVSLGPCAIWTDPRRGCCCKTRVSYERMIMCNELQFVNTVAHKRDKDRPRKAQLVSETNRLAPQLYISVICWHQTWRGENTSLSDCCSRNSLSWCFLFSVCDQKDSSASSQLFLNFLLPNQCNQWHNKWCPTRINNRSSVIYSIHK